MGRLPTGLWSPGKFCAGGQVRAPVPALHQLQDGGCTHLSVLGPHVHTAEPRLTPVMRPTPPPPGAALLPCPPPFCPPSFSLFLPLSLSSPITHQHLLLSGSPSLLCVKTGRALGGCWITHIGDLNQITLQRDYTNKAIKCHSKGNFHSIPRIDCTSCFSITLPSLAASPSLFSLTPPLSPPDSDPFSSPLHRACLPPKGIPQKPQNPRANLPEHLTRLTALPGDALSSGPQASSNLRLFFRP